MAETHRIEVPPVPAGVERPMWSVMIPTYNCAGYLRETLASVLAQDPGPDRMQIEVVDDYSTADDPEAVVREMGKGRVAFYRQSQNVGHTRNFDTCLRRARGHLVHLLHGDDTVRDGFYREIGRAFEMHPEIGAAYCRQMIMDEDGHWIGVTPLEEPVSRILPNWLERIAVGNRLNTPAMVVRREVYEKLGGFDHRIASYGEDWEMWVRIAAQYLVWYETEPLAVYRNRSTSLSGRTVRTGENGRDLREVIKINRAHLPPESMDRITQEARIHHARRCVRQALNLAGSGDMYAASAQLRESIRFSRSPGIIALASSVFAYLLARKAMPHMRLR